MYMHVYIWVCSVDSGVYWRLWMRRLLFRVPPIFRRIHFHAVTAMSDINVD